MFPFEVQFSKPFKIDVALQAHATMGKFKAPYLFRAREMGGMRGTLHLNESFHRRRGAVWELPLLVVCDHSACRL